MRSLPLLVEFMKSRWCAVETERQPAVKKQRQRWGRVPGIDTGTRKAAIRQLVVVRIRGLDPKEGSVADIFVVRVGCLRAALRRRGDSPVLPRLDWRECQGACHYF